MNVHKTKRSDSYSGILGKEVHDFQIGQNFFLAYQTMFSMIFTCADKSQILSYIPLSDPWDR